ncbi:MAG: hypothetical protein J6A09_04455 [Alphaproteobacteria bacterium]|nr:hypothetical protein [Alphaproteobacteria bacterium]
MRPARSELNAKSLRLRRALKKLTGFMKQNLILITLTLAVLFGLTASFADWDGAYADSDGYMRALRIKELINNPSFYETPLLFSNYPFGEVLHWTRPMDILWLIMTLPFLYLNNLNDIIFISGAFISPALFILTALALTYGLRRRFNPWLTLFGVLIFLNSPRNVDFFSPGRPDHHALMILLSVFSLSLVLCWLKKRQDRYLRLLGISLSFATFTAIEGILIYAIFLNFFICLYIKKNLSLTPTVKITKYFALSFSFFYLLNPPYEGWLYPDNGRISILFVTAAWFAYFALLGLKKARLHTAKLKLLSLSATTLAALLLLVLIFKQDIFISPLSSEIKIWSSSIFEMRNITNLDFPLIIKLYLLPSISLIITFYLLPLPAYRRIMFLNLCIGLPLFALTLFAIRFTCYEPLYTILPFIALADKLYKASPFATHQSDELPDNLFAYLLTFFVIQSLLIVPAQLASSNNKTGSAVVSFSPALNQNIRNIGGTLVTHIFLTPRFVFSCDVNTVGTPYHRNIEGITDHLSILNAEDDQTLIPLLLKHQVTQILVYDGYQKLSEKHPHRLINRLIERQNLPPFLEEIPTSVKNARHYQIKF